MKRKICEWLKSKKWVSVLSFILFGIMTCGALLKVTYLFRIVNTDRRRIVCIKEEHDLDMIYIGGSAAFVYWEPPRAWGEYGITSYDYATNSIRAESIIGNIREVSKYQDTDFIVIDARPFEYWSDTIGEDGIRHITDSMDYSWNRWKMVYEYLSNIEKPENINEVSFYFDIAKYHTNMEALGSETNWDFIDNEGYAFCNGGEIYDLHEELNKPTDFMTKECMELQEGSEKTLIKLLEYCRKEKKDVLFVVCPYRITKEQKMMYNSIQRIVESYGFAFLDANEHYDDMEIDFSKDFYNINHVNVYGAEKYTRFLAEYIQENYDLIDHRKEQGTEKWEEMYDMFCGQDENVKSAVNSLIESKEEAYDEGIKLKDTDNIYEWCTKIQDENYTVLIESQDRQWISNNNTEKILDLWNIPYDGNADVIRIYNGITSKFDSDSILEKNYAGEFPGHSDYNKKYEINSGTNAGIQIDGEEYSMMQSGLNIVVYDNNYRKVLDSVVIQQTEEGELILKRR